MKVIPNRVPVTSLDWVAIHTCRSGGTIHLSLEYAYLDKSYSAVSEYISSLVFCLPDLKHQLAVSRMCSLMQQVLQHLTSKDFD